MGRLWVCCGSEFPGIEQDGAKATESLQFLALLAGRVTQPSLGFWNQELAESAYSVWMRNCYNESPRVCSLPSKVIVKSPPNLSGSNPQNALDEFSFQQLLSAAFVVQEHNELLQSGRDAAIGPSSLLSDLVEVQEKIRGARMEWAAAAALIAKRLQKITGADGAAITVLRGDQLEYCAATGAAAGDLAAMVPIEESLSAQCCLNGTLLQIPDAEQEPLLANAHGAAGLKSLIAVPMNAGTKIIGSLEVRFGHARGFQPRDVHATRLMADLAAETLAATADPSQRKAAASEHDFLVETLERVRPHLSRLANTADGGVAAFGEDSGNGGAGENAATVCRSCGHQVKANESFCGNCGTARSASRPLQNTWASLWDLQRAAEKKGIPLESSADGTPDPLEVLPSELEALLSQFSGTTPPGPPASDSRAGSLETAAEKAPAAAPLDSVVPSRPEDAASDAASKKWKPDEFSSYGVASERVVTPAGRGTAPSSGHVEQGFASFEPDRLFRDAIGREEANGGTANSISTHSAADAGLQQTSEWTSPDASGDWTDTAEKRESSGATFWRTQRANIYLVAAAVLLLLVLFGAGAPSAPLPDSAAKPVSTTTTVHAHVPLTDGQKPQTEPQPELSLMDKMLINLGLAEAPEPPPYMGNPRVRVWEDVHTALYYCPGTELYGRSDGGRFTTQKDAQFDQFQPASRRPCD